MSSKVSMPSKIFGTVLSHGLRGRMLTKGELQTLAESRDIEELVTRTKNTVYLDALAKLTKPYTAEKVEGALREYLVNMHAKMVTIAGGSTILDAYFVKYITRNLKLVLKGKALGKTYEELLPKINLTRPSCRSGSRRSTASRRSSEPERGSRTSAAATASRPC